MAPRGRDDREQLSSAPVNSMSIKRRLLSRLRCAFYWSGFSPVYTALRGICGSVILMYHSVPGAAERPWIDPENAMPLARFEWQMEFLHRHRRVVSLDEVVDAIAARRELTVGTVVLTFDDGYRDNLHVVAPILERYRFPAVLYLPTEYINRGQTHFIDELYAIFSRRKADTFRWESGPEGRWELRDPAIIAQAYKSVVAALIAAGMDARQRILADLADQLRPEARPPRLTLNWDEVRELVKRYPNFQIGAHTADHVDLRAHGDQAQVQIARSVSDIERELGFKSVHFSFPYGRYGEAGTQAVIDNGLKSAVVAGEDCLIGVGSSPFGMARIAAPESMTRFRSITSGAYFGLSGAVASRE